MTTILVLCGLPGTGKSTYAKNYLKRLMDSMIQNMQKPHLSEGFNAVLTPN